jgi:hypothetical protein
MAEARDVPVCRQTLPPDSSASRKGSPDVPGSFWRLPTRVIPVGWCPGVPFAVLLVAHSIIPKRLNGLSRNAR